MVELKVDKIMTRLDISTNKLPSTKLLVLVDPRPQEPQTPIDSMLLLTATPELELVETMDHPMSDPHLMLHTMTPTERVQAVSAVL